jgi:hypothetical protein
MKTANPNADPIPASTPAALAGVDVDDRIPDHHRVGDAAAGETDRLEEAARVGLADPEGVPHR